jgi:hypothetical protein
MEPWAFSNKLIYLDDGVTLRERKFGLVEIIDENVAEAFDTDSCRPAVTQATAEKVGHRWRYVAIIEILLCGNTEWPDWLEKSKKIRYV